MKLATFALAALTVLFANTSHASIYISCGTGEPNEEMSYGENQELQISSADDVFEGPVGGTWELKLGANEDWMQPTPSVTAVLTGVEGARGVEVTIQSANTPSGPVGIRYILNDIYSDTPSLEKYTYGGFTGAMKIGEYNCVSAID
jgi:hypothetical protein